MGTSGKFLKQARTSQGLSQKDVANKLGYKSAQFISNWERGVSYPPISVLQKLADIFRIPVESVYNAVLEQHIQEMTNKIHKKFNARKRGPIPPPPKVRLEHQK